MKKVLLLIAVTFLFVGCVEEAKEAKQIGNFKVEFLFEQDGCKMYRFNDGGRYVYWSDCRGKVQSDYTSGGKHRTTHYEETITTE